MKTVRMKALGCLVLVVFLTGTTGCATLTGAGAGALIGAAFGAPGTGALIGAGAGLILDGFALRTLPPGAVYGQYVDPWGRPICRDPWGRYRVWNGRYWQRY